MLAAFFLTQRHKDSSARSFLFCESFEEKIIPTFKPLNQRSNLNFSYLSKPPKHKPRRRNACSIFLTLRHEDAKAQSFFTQTLKGR